MKSTDFLQGSPFRDIQSVDELRRLDLQAIRDLVSSATSPFAFGVHLDDGTSVAAVDRFAIKSACYLVDGKDLSFAARADELASSSPEIDLQAIYDYLYFHVIPSPRTMFRRIFRVPAGHLLIARQGEISVQPYWQPKFTEPARGSISFQALKSEFLELLRSAVASRLDHAHPACFLSGGTDSSTIAGMAAEVSGGQCHTYSIGFEAEGYDEMAFARIASARFGTTHHEYYVTPEDLVRSIGSVAAAYDQPFGNSSSLPSYYCALNAKRDGVGRLLAGDGGDELFGGNKRYATQRVFGVFDQLPSTLQALSASVFLSTPIGQLPLLRKGASYIRQAQVPLPDRLQTYNLLERLGPHDVLSRDFLSQIDTAAPASHQEAVWASIQATHPLNRQLAFDWRYTLAENDLPKVCGTCGLANVDVAFPMLDTELVDFSARLPVSYKLRGLKLRWFFKEALRDFLPTEIIHKKKQGFGLPFGVWAVRHAELNALARESLESFSTRGVVNPQFIRTLLDEHLRAHPGYYGEMVWILMMLEQWLRRHAPAFKL